MKKPTTVKKVLKTATPKRVVQQTDAEQLSYDSMASWSDDDDDDNMNAISPPPAPKKNRADAEVVPRGLAQPRSIVFGAHRLILGCFSIICPP